MVRRKVNPLFIVALAVLAVYAALVAQQPAVTGSSAPSPMRLVARVDTTGLQANVGSTALYAVPAGGDPYFLVCAYNVITTAGTTSTLPNVFLGFTDKDANVAGATPLMVLSTAANAAGDVGGIGSAPTTNCMMIHPKPGTTVNYGTANYASTGTQMTYAIHVKIFQIST